MADRERSCPGMSREVANSVESGPPRTGQKAIGMCLEVVRKTVFRLKPFSNIC